MSRPTSILLALSLLLSIAAASSAAAAVSAEKEEDTRPFLKTYSLDYASDQSSSTFSLRALQSLKFEGNDKKTYKLCEGDCDDNKDCADGLKCYQRDGTKSVPGCRGDGIPDVDYCIEDEKEKDDKDDDDDDDKDDEDEKPDNLGKNFDELTNISNGDKGHGKCSGDCDDDNDCKDGLKCFQRDGDETVPGCNGKGDSKTDYCYDPDDEIPRNDDKLTLYDDLKEFGDCQGDCEDDDECRGDRICFDPKGESTVPGCDGEAKDGKKYCIDKDDLPEPAPEPEEEVEEETIEVVVQTDEPTESPTKKPTKKPTKSPTPKPSPLPTRMPSKSPTKAPVVDTAKPSGSPTRKPSKAPTEAAIQVTAEPTSKPTRKPSASPTRKPSASPTKAPVEPEPTVPEAIVPEDVGIAVPPFVVGVSFLTPTRHLKASNRYLLLAENIDEDMKLREVVEGLVGQRMFALYPETYQDVDLKADFLDETEKDGMTTVRYTFTGMATFLDDYTGEGLPHSEDIKSATMEALDGTALTDQLRWSGDPVLEAVQITSVEEPRGIDIEISEETPTESPPNESGGVQVGIIILVAVIVACVLVIGGAFIYLRKSRRASADKLVSQRPVEEGSSSKHNDLSASYTKKKNSSPKGGTGILPSPTKTSNTALGDSYERNSVDGDFSLSEVCSDSNAGDSAMDSVMDSSVGRSDWSVDGGNIASGSSLADDLSLQGDQGPLFARRNVELTGTLRSLDEVEGEEGAQRNRAHSEAESSTNTDGIEALGEIKLGTVLSDLQVDEVDGQKGADDFKNVWRSSSKNVTQKVSTEELSPKNMYGVQLDDDSVARGKSAGAEEALKEMIGVLNPAGAAAQDLSIDTISEAHSADEQSQSGGSIIGSILGMLPGSGKPDKTEDDSIASEEEGSQHTM